MLETNSSSLPHISVFTPSHSPIYLDQCYQSLQSQTYHDWEWIVVLNNGAQWQLKQPDSRVTILNVSKVKGVGEAKYLAC